MKSIFFVFLCVAALIPSLSAGAADPKDWGRVAAPTQDAAAVIGSPAAGCLQGALPLQSGDGFEVLRTERKRYFGHPDLLRFVHWLGAEANRLRLGTLLVGDLAQPRGGPMVYGHGSHQNGLDADIMFRIARTPLTADELRDPAVPSVVKNRQIDPTRWDDGFTQLLKLSATAPEVDRIFVNPAIKATLCRDLPPDERSWLHKLRPWWGHDDHFHVRLKCPDDSPLCKTQAPPPEGDGCGYEVMSWLDRPTLNIPVNKPNTRNVVLPPECKPVLHGAK